MVADTNANGQRLGLSPTIVAVALGQAALSFNVVSLPIAMSGLVKSFGVPPTTISAAIVTYSLAAASFVMVGSKLSQRFGAVKVFRIAVALFVCGQVLMTTSPSAAVMILAQGLCGVAAAILVPNLVMLVAKSVPRQQQAAALGVLGASGAVGAITALIAGGLLGTYIGWRPAFGLLTVLLVVLFFWSFRLDADDGTHELQIDVGGAVLAAVAIVLLSVGFSNLGNWGVGLARTSAPLDLFGISPAPVLIVLGIVVAQVFLSWTKGRQGKGKAPLFEAEIVGTPYQRIAIYVVFAMAMLESMLNFAMPLYIQLVQGRSPAETAIAMMPFNLSVFIASLFVVRMYGRRTPQQIGRYGFAMCAIALFWLAFAVKNDWSTVSVVAGLVVFGAAQGALMTLVFSVLLAAAPADLSGDVGALRGTTQNLAVAIGTAVAGALLVGLLSSSVIRSVAASYLLPDSLVSQVDLDNINFISNDHLREALARTSATSAQVAEAVAINTEARLRAIKIAFLVMGAMALLTIIPAGRLPKQFDSNKQ